MRSLKFLFPVITVVLCIPNLTPGQSQSVDSRLDIILKDIQTARDDAEAGAKARTEKYIEDLKALEKKIAATGDLDKVLQISKERKTWEAGKPSAKIDPKDKSVVLDLRKARYYFDQELLKLQARNVEANNALVARLDELVSTLTKERKIPAALEVRKIKDDFLAGTLKVVTKPDTPTQPSEVTMNTTKVIGSWEWLFDGQRLELKESGEAIIHLGNYQLKGDWKMLNPNQAQVNWKDKSTPNPKATTATISFSPDGKSGELHRGWDDRRKQIKRVDSD